MIRNIVFDMGKVLVDYSGMPVCRHFTDNEALAKRVCTAVFDSPEWVLLDMGVITEEDGIKKMISRLDTEEEKKLRDIFKPYINGCNEKQPLTSDAPPEAVEAFEKWKELSLRLDKEAEELIMGWEIVKESK